MLDAAGNLLGINTHRIGEGFYLAIPADERLAAKVASLAAGEPVRGPRLGVGVAPAEVARRLRAAVGLDPVDGLLVRHVEDGSAAARAGIREGDLIVSVAGRATPDVDTLHQILDESQGSVEIRLVRGAEEVTLTAQI